ncbi:MAG: hypothetical protein RLO52_14600 [Sandaracinaceae bacterium]
MPLTIFEASEDFCAFPEPEDVFAERVAEHAELLLPLAAVDLALVDPELEGTVHFILPIEPDEGCVGEGGDAVPTGLDGDHSHRRHRCPGSVRKVGHARRAGRRSSSRIG